MRGARGASARLSEGPSMGQLSSRRYEIHRVLGKGGTGVVYEAYDSKDHTVVALKTIDSREAEHLYRLKHLKFRRARRRPAREHRPLRGAHPRGRAVVLLDGARPREGLSRVRPSALPREPRGGRARRRDDGDPPEPPPRVRQRTDGDGTDLVPRWRRRSGVRRSEAPLGARAARVRAVGDPRGRARAPRREARQRPRDR